MVAAILEFHVCMYILGFFIYIFAIHLMLAASFYKFFFFYFFQVTPILLMHFKQKTGQKIEKKMQLTKQFHFYVLLRPLPLAK